MGTIADKLIYLSNTKQLIKDALISKGVTVANGETFREYASKIAAISSNSDEWSRPSYWLLLPEVLPGQQKIIALGLVKAETVVNLSAVGAFTVNWGDGEITNYNGSAVTAKTYDFNSLPSSTQTPDGYRQVIVTITPQAGNNLTTFTANTAPKGNSYSDYFVDMALAGSNFTLLNFGFNIALEQVKFIGSNNITTGLSSGFSNCWKLQSVEMFTGNATTLLSLFSNCYNLIIAPVLDTSKVTTFANIFSNCSKLKTVPLYNTSKVTTFSQAFLSCTELETVPLFDTVLAVTFISMFNGCTKLKSLPLFNTVKVANYSNTFAGCTMLETIPSFNTSGVGSCTYAAMLSNCSYLKTVPALDVSNASALTAFTNNFNLKRVMFTGAKLSFSLSGSALDKPALIEVFTNLGTATGAATINITSTSGAASLTAPDRAIATGKGWTIIG